MRQETDLVDIDLDFRYTGTNYEDLTELALNVLEYQAYFQTMDWTKEELQYISEQLVETGKIFAVNQGFSPGGHGPGISATPFNISNREATGNLYHSIKAEVKDKQIRFYNDAKNYRGQPYAGHMEYGFHDRGGKFVPARPFMRPAFYAVSEGSKGNFQQIMKGLLDNLYTGRGFNGLSMTFGRKAGSQSLFWKQNGSFGSKLSQRTRMRELKGNDSKHRKFLSANRRGGRKTGYRFAKTKKEFGMKTSQQRALKKFEQERKQRLSQKDKGKKSVTKKRLSTSNRQSQFNPKTKKQLSYLSEQKTRLNQGGSKPKNQNNSKPKSQNKPSSSNSQNKGSGPKKVGGVSKSQYINEYMKTGLSYKQAAKRWAERFGGLE